MLWKVEQNSLEAMEIGIERKCKTDTWLGGGKPQGLEAMEIAAKERLG